MVSEHDGYLPQVEFLMKLAGIEVVTIREDYITSTTQIINKYNTKNQLEDLIHSINPRYYKFS